MKLCTASSSLNSPKILDPIRYKTVLCKNFALSGTCPYREKCQFAHGEEEKRDKPRKRRGGKGRKRAGARSGSPSNFSELSSPPSSPRSLPLSAPSSPRAACVVCEARPPLSPLAPLLPPGLGHAFEALVLNPSPMGPSAVSPGPCPAVSSSMAACGSPSYILQRPAPLELPRALPLPPATRPHVASHQLAAAPMPAPPAIMAEERFLAAEHREPSYNTVRRSISLLWGSDDRLDSMAEMRSELVERAADKASPFLAPLPKTLGEALANSPQKWSVPAR